MLPFKRVTSKYLGELLLERKIITKEDLDKALKIQKARGGLIGEILVQFGAAKEEDIAQTLTSQYGFPYLPLSNYEIDPEVIKHVPKNVCLQYCLVPVDTIGNSITVAMSNPLNHQAIEDIEELTKCSVQLYVSTTTDVRQAIAKYYKNK